MNKVDENKKFKIAVKYIGKPNEFHRGYDPETTVNTVKRDAMSDFQITASPDDFCLQFGEETLNDAMTLIDTTIPCGMHRSLLDLVAREKTDTDGDVNHA